FAALSGFVTADTFVFMQSILFVLVVVIGGAGTVAGPVIGAVIVGVLPELLASLEDYRLLFFGALLLLVLWVAPEGVVGLLRQVRGKAAPSGADAAAPATVAPELPRRGRASLAARGLGITFGGVRAVSDLSLDMPAGKITSLIGPNGAGKTTALNMLSGFYRPSSGAVTLAARKLDGLAAFRIARTGLARTYQTSQLFGSLSVEDNVVLAMGRGRLGGLFSAGRFHGKAAREQARALLAFCGYQGSPTANAAGLDRKSVG